VVEEYGLFFAFIITSFVKSEEPSTKKAAKAPKAPKPKKGEKKAQEVVTNIPPLGVCSNVVYFYVLI
jgi:hypothetical protein